MSDDDDELDELWSTEAKPSATVHELKKPKPSVPQKGKHPYAAMLTQDKTHGFILDCPSTGQEHYYFYYHLQPLTANKPAYDFLFFKAAGNLITVYGRNLQPIVAALWMHHCRSLTEFSPELHAAPTDHAAPFIERIEVAAIKSAADTEGEPKPTRQVMFTDPQGGVQ